MALLIALVPFGIQGGEPGQPSVEVGPSLRLTSIDLAPEIDYESERIQATAVLEMENLSDAPESRASLLLGRLLRFDRAETMDGAAIPFRQEIVTFVDSPRKQVDQAILHLRTPIAPRGRARVRVAYSGYLVGYAETGSLYIQDHVDPAFTILRSDAYAFPVVGVASDSANRSIPFADFSFDLRVTVPEGLTVANGAELVDRIPRGQRTTWHYRSAAVPFLNVAIAKYDVAEKDGIRVFSFPADREGAARVMRSAVRAVDLFRSWFGPTSTAPRFAVIEIPPDYGSQASIAGGIIQTASTFREPGAMIELYHEISHFWNPRDLDSPSPRINEGLAMYLQLQAAREIDGAADAEARLNKRVERVLEASGKDPRLAATPMNDYGKAGMTDWSYSVGQLMFGLLEKSVGAERFREIVGGFYQKYKETGATTADFAAWVKSHGGTAAERLLADWLTSTRWLERLKSGETLDAMAKGYRSAA
jgi:aminopeptidase N